MLTCVQGTRGICFSWHRLLTTILVGFFFVVSLQPQKYVNSNISTHGLTSVVTFKIPFLVHTICKKADFVTKFSLQPWQKLEIQSIRMIHICRHLTVENNFVGHLSRHQIAH
jgi:hypothetical protein